MDEARAKELLGIPADDPNTGLYMNKEAYFAWAEGEVKAFIEGEFTADQFEALAWWMRNH